MQIENHQSVGYMVNLCARLFAQRMTEGLASFSVTPAYLPVLVTLAETGDLTLGELAAHASIEQPTMTRTVTRMVRDGLVLRSIDPTDGRRTTIRLTSRGESVVPHVLSVAGVVNSQAMAGMTSLVESALLEQLARLASNLRNRDVIRDALLRAAQDPATRSDQERFGSGS